MDIDQQTYQAWAKGMEFWAGLWHQQMEQSLKFWALMGQSMPHESARELSAEADAMRATPSRKAKTA